MENQGQSGFEITFDTSVPEPSDGSRATRLGITSRPSLIQAIRGCICYRDIASQRMENRRGRCG
jgi:hypothetical protein